MNHYSLYLLLPTLFILAINLSVFGTAVHKFLVTQDDDHDVPVKLTLDKASRTRESYGSISETSLTPVVFWHGMGDTAYGSINTDRLALQERYPNLTVWSVEIGNNQFEDELGSYFVNVNYQIRKVCHEILNNHIIKKHGSFNAVGFSQGAQFLRGLIQRCPLQENKIKVKNFVSIGGQHQGVFGLPRCDGMAFCNYIRHLLTRAAFERGVQENVVQAEYWHDPIKEDEYRKNSIFIAEINNENHINETYKRNLLAMNNFVMVKFVSDQMVVPSESSWFGFYESGQSSKVLELEETALYKDDRLGLRQMKEEGRLHRISLPGNHLVYNMSWFLDDIAAIYLFN